MRSSRHETPKLSEVRVRGRAVFGARVEEEDGLGADGDVVTIDVSVNDSVSMERVERLEDHIGLSLREMAIENRGASRSDSRRSLSGAWGAEPPISIGFRRRGFQPYGCVVTVDAKHELE